MSSIFKRLAINIGNLIVISGIIHLLLGFFEYREGFSEIVRLGVVNTADKNLKTFGFFWFEISGIFVIFIGLFIQHYPQKMGWCLLAIATCRCILELNSGFYFYVFISTVIILKNNHG